MQMKIKQFAHQHNINEAIVLGFYQHDINLYSIKKLNIKRDKIEYSNTFSIFAINMTSHASHLNSAPGEVFEFYIR